MHRNNNNSNVVAVTTTILQQGNNLLIVRKMNTHFSRKLPHFTSTAELYASRTTLAPFPFDAALVLPAVVSKATGIIQLQRQITRYILFISQLTTPVEMKPSESFGALHRESCLKNP